MKMDLRCSKHFVYNLLLMKLSAKTNCIPSSIYIKFYRLHFLVLL